METIRIDMSQTIPVKCKQCDGEFFFQGCALRIIPALLSPTGQKAVQPMPVFLCFNCGTPAEPIEKPQKKD